MRQEKQRKMKNKTEDTIKIGINMINYTMRIQMLNSTSTYSDPPYTPFHFCGFCYPQ